MHVTPSARPHTASAAWRPLSTLPLLALALVSACHVAPKPTLAPALPPASRPVQSGVQTAARPAVRDSVVPPRPEEVRRTAVNVFGDTAATVVVDVDSTVPDGPTWDIDVRSYEGQERVMFYVNLFTQGSRARFQERLRLGTRYEPMIRAKLRAGGIPEDMTYLALVESGYDPNAYSSAAAVGMWQFMSSTARDVGLRVDWWIDERRDPARSTDAAIRFLRDLQNQFGSLYLAAAAYNGGPGRVSRGLTRFADAMAGSEGEDRFFALAEHDYLRSETKNYVPQIIAAALIGKEPIRYGFAFDSLSEYVYDSLQVAAGTPLAAVAQASGVDIATIKELNPSVLRGIVPPAGPIWLHVPLNPALPPEQIATALAGLSEEDRIGYHTVKSTGSESAAAVALKAGVTARELAWYNPSLKATKKGKLLAGQTVRVPTAAAVAGAVAVPDPAIERYGSSTVTAARSGSVHVVKRGESLRQIAETHGVSVARLKSLNSLKGDHVVAGQVLRVRAATVPRRAASRTASAKSSGASSNHSRASTTKSPAAGTAKASARKRPATGP